MAVKVNNDGSVSRVQPKHGMYFNVTMLEDIVGGWPEPTKVGPVWIILNSDASRKPDNINEVASKFFQLPIYGDIVSLSPLELPPEWDLVEDHDRNYTVDESDEGFIDALSNRMLVDPFSMHMGFGLADHWASEDHKDYFGVNGINLNNKEEFFYNPNKPKAPETTDDNYKKFLKDSFSHIVNCEKENFKDFIVFEDDVNIVKVRSKDDRIKTINQVIDALIEVEDYEKCAKLKGILDKNFSNTDVIEKTPEK